MSVHLEWRGLTEFLREFGAVPEVLTHEGMAIVREETEGAAVEITQRYPRVTGNLVKRVRTEYPASQLLIGVVYSASPHAHLYEWGTKKRVTSGGRSMPANLSRGTMPTDKITPDIARRRRARMARRLVEMLRRVGFKVGDAG